MTDRKESRFAEDSGPSNEEPLRLIAKAAHVGVFDWSIAEGWLNWDPYHRHLLGVPNQPPRLSFSEFLELIHPEDQALVNDTAIQGLAGSNDYACEFRLVLPSGGTRWIQQRGQIQRTASGAPARVRGIMQDITERKLLEQEREHLLGLERKARATAEAAAQAREDFIATVSHELRAPLNAMFGWARILKSGKYDEATLAHAVEVIERSVQLQKQLIDDLLDTARIINGKLRLEPQPVDLMRVLDAAADAARPAIKAKGQTLELDVQSVDVVTGDASRLQQVLANLLGNAIKFTPRGGRITVRLERCDPQMRITVSDTGKGISPELLPQIFNRFEQADRNSTRRSGGLGLGLALVKQIVELHGGTVEAHSPGVEQGATFIVNLPLRALRISSPAAATWSPDWPMVSPNAATSPILEGVRALVVDDEFDARDLLATLLKQYGATVTSAASAAEALDVLHTAAAHNELPDVLISDIGMPDEDGYQLIQQVRALSVPQGGALPAIALTAFSRSADRIRALSAGFQSHLVKPVEPVELALVVGGLTGRA